jgi:hypothetical protein
MTTSLQFAAEKKRLARLAVARAIESGELVRPLSCERCRAMPAPVIVNEKTPFDFEMAGIHAHHEDYNLPLYVQWLCRRCHMIRHKMEKPLATFLARQIVRKWCTNQLGNHKRNNVNANRAPLVQRAQPQDVILAAGFGPPSARGRPAIEGQR